MLRVLLFFTAVAAAAATVPLDLTGVKPGPVRVTREGETAVVRWEAAGREWRAAFSLDPARPLIESISAGGRTVVQGANPVYQCQTGKRRGGFDEFFDFPPSHPDGTRAFTGALQLSGARAVTAGNRVELIFDGFRMGIFEGSIRYVFFPGSRLIQQIAVAKTMEPDTAYFYDAGLRMAVPENSRPGGNMESEFVYYDTEGAVRTSRPNVSERVPLRARYRTVAVKTGGGALGVFPAPHQYFMPRDFTTNMGYLWHTAWRGSVWLGVRQLPDDNSRFYPWMNAPPGTEQRMSVFYLAGDGDAKTLLDDVLRYTNRDRFPRLEGYRTLAAHWHFAYTVQAMAKGKDWVPPFKPVLKQMGVDAAMIADFHGDGHPQDLTDLRLRELKAYYDFSRAQSDRDFLLIPSEEANVHYGGHWAVAFPKPVYWFMAKPGTPSGRQDVPGYGEVNTVGDSKALLDLMRREKGFVYQTHPRTKGSKLYPDKIRHEEFFIDPTFFGAGWKQMPADMSSPRLGERSLKLLDDMNNWGLQKRLIAEVDVFQIDHTHELYAHMNVNYVRATALPDFDRYGDLLDRLKAGDFFMSTGEVLLPGASIAAGDGDQIIARAQVIHTFPLRMAEVVWGDGSETRRQVFPLESTGEFGRQPLELKLSAPGWRWARLAVWDVAGNGAFVNPSRRR